MGYCPVCGCKTDELDFTEKAIGEKTEKICSFCYRQLNGFEGENAPTEAQLRWLSAVYVKEVDRDENILGYLKALNDKFIPKQEEPVKPPVSGMQKPQQMAQQKPVTAGVGKPALAHFGKEQSTVEELTKRVAALEAEIRALKRKQMIKTIIELGVPFIMLILLIIIFFATGLADGISEFMDIIESDFM